MPNMDDISYFGSTEYAHRGGIWPDAARRERQPTTISISPDPNAHLSQIQIETAPESLPTTLVSPPPPTQDPNLPAFLAEDHKDQDQEHIGDDHQKDESFETSSPPRSATSAISQPRSVSSTTTKRRSWFMTARDEDDNTDSEPSLPHADEEMSRGRPVQIAPDSPSSSRSVSTHSDVGLVSNSTQSEPSSLPKTPPPLPRRRDLPPRPSELDDTVPAPSKPLFGRVGTNASANPNGSSTSTFFSTLKARAVDKEGLKDTAKETMKRWGANLASLRKGGSDEPASGGDDGQAKRSYAEIRKHVEDRHRTSTSPGPSNETPSLGASERDSPSPRTQRGSRNLSISGSYPVGPSTSDSDSASHTGSQDALADRDEASHDREPETDVTPPPHPIYTQPSAPKMMMIPGIHASHRGEVQSMGYVAPTPEPAELKLKAPVIQSVYRLWKNPGSSQPTESLHLEGGDFDSPSSQPSRSDSPMSTSSNLKRQVPPPLPARTATMRPPETSVTKASPDPAEFGNVSASAALKSIASLDNNSRRHSSSSFEHAENLQPPQEAVTGDL
jgi:hypothetical protein